MHEARNYFADSLESALQRHNYTVSPEVKTYVVEMLASFVQSSDVCRMPITFQYFEGVRASSLLERSERWQKLGDECLFLVGFFYDSLRKDGMSMVRFHSDIGSSAYARCGNSVRKKYHLENTVFDQLAGQFWKLGEMIGDLHLPSLENTQQFFDIYVKWQETQDKRYASLLHSKENIILVKDRKN